MKSRVFVSSIMSDFEEFRAIARKAIEQCNCEPIMMEDYPSLAESSRNACLQAVASSDVYLAIIGARGGWVAPSGMLAVEEEFEEAKKRKLPVLVFIQDVEMDEQATRLKEKLSDYVSGFFRKKFSSALDLEKLITDALPNVVHQIGDIAHLQQEINAYLQAKNIADNETRLHFLLAPERREEVIDPIKMGDDELKNQLHRIAHDPEVRLMSYERGKKTLVGIDTLSICESASGSHSARETCLVNLVVNSKGWIIIDIAIEKDSPSSRPSIADMIILEADITRDLRKSFAFAAKFYGERDPYHRHSRFLFNIAMSGVGMKPFLKTYPSGNQVQLASNRMMSGGFNVQKMLLAFDAPRLITRSDLADEDETLEPALEMFRRRLS